MGAAQLNGQAVDLSSDLTTIGAVAASEGYIEWNTSAGAQALSIWTGTAAPVGTLGGRVTAPCALYIRQGGGLGTLLYATVDTGTNWKTVTFA